MFVCDDGQMEAIMKACVRIAKQSSNVKLVENCAFIPFCSLKTFLRYFSPNHNCNRPSNSDNFRICPTCKEDISEIAPLHSILNSQRTGEALRDVLKQGSYLKTKVANHVQVYLFRNSPMYRCSI